LTEEEPVTAEDDNDFSGRRLEDLDFTHARLHSASFGWAKITDAWLYNADISGDIEGLRINGVEVAPLVEAERTRSAVSRAREAALH
jgi:uncharacterized protein YjbI with pentapeptide repeats